MASTKTIPKNFNNFAGRDSRSSDLVRDRDFATDFTNVIISKEKALQNRKGGKILAPNGQFLGLHTYSWSDPDTGGTEEEIISISDNLYRRRDSTFTVAYAGASSSVTFNFLLDSDALTYKCKIVEDGVQKLNYDVGTGLESTPVTLANLKTQIDAISGGLYSATISGTTTYPAAILPLVINETLGTTIISYCDWQAVNSTTTNPFGSYYGARGDDDFEHASFTNLNDVTYIATGYEYLHKYDGQTVYRAGLPRPSAGVSVADAGAGNVNSGVHKYIYIYQQVDAKGNITESKEAVEVSYDTTTGGVGARSLNLTLATIQAGSGFNTHAALVNGNQVGVTTITVTNTPHTFKAGDTAYFLDRSSSTYVSREITAVTATTIVISGAGVDVNNTDVISNNLKILVFRTKLGGVDYFQVGETPNNSFAASLVFNDNVADANLGAQYFFPFKSHDLLDKKPKYVCGHQNILIAAGAFTDPNTIFCSQIEDSESFPAASNQFDVASTYKGGVSGIASDEEHLLIGKANSLFVANGDIDANNFRVEKLTEGTVGVACHNTMKDVGGAIVFLSERGFFMVQGGSQLVEIGFPINKDFYEFQLNPTLNIKYRRSFATFYPKGESYICFIPDENDTGTSKYASSDSLLYVYDSANQAWIDWEAINMGGGVCVEGNNLWWQSKRSDDTLTVTGNLYREHLTGTNYDYADHDNSIEMRYGSSWEAGGEPGVNKYFSRVILYNITRDLGQSFATITIKTERDFQYGVRDTETTFSFGGASASLGWGLFPWGISPWGTPVNVLPRSKKLKSSTKARAMRFLFLNGIHTADTLARVIHQKVNITGWEIEMIMAYAQDLE